MGIFFLKSVNLFLSTIVVVFSVRLGDDIYVDKSRSCQTEIEVFIGLM